MFEWFDRLRHKLDNELIHGFNAGIGQSIIGHPIDTYKTWLQVNHKEKITIRGLYRGYPYPAFTSGIVSGIAFHAYEWCKKRDQQWGMLTGSILAGCTTAITSGYFEYKKIKEQLRTTARFQSAGCLTLLMREIPACMFYYPVYDMLRTLDMPDLVSPSGKIPVPIAGGIAGVTCWLSSYWADVLNTHVMSGNTLASTIKKLHFRDYFKGLGVVLPRAFAVNAVGYFFYELSKKII